MNPIKKAAAIAMPALLLSLFVGVNARAQAPVNHPVFSPPDSELASPRGQLSTAQAGKPAAPPLKELPDFSVTDRNARVTSAVDLSRPTHWLLLLRTKNCLPCDRLMNVLASGQSAALTRGTAMIVVIGGGQRDDIEKVRSGFPTFSDAAWFADTQSEAFKAFKAKGTPTLIALDGKRIQWTVSGNLGNPAVVESLAAAWLDHPVDRPLTTAAAAKK